MRTNGYQTYLENEILSASPMGLIQLMYAAALDSIAAARRALRAGEIHARSRAITQGDASRYRTIPVLESAPREANSAKTWQTSTAMCSDC